MPLPAIDSLQEDDAYLVDLGRGVWLMDDHRWALKVWETERERAPFTLIHADYHWDCVYDFHGDDAKEGALIRATPAELFAIIEQGDLIGFDSFLAPAVRRGLIQTVHFYCLQGDAASATLDADFLAKCHASQVIHDSPESLAAIKTDRPLIFDLCLDLFNRSDQWAEGDLWLDDDVCSFMRLMQPLIRCAHVVTVSMSFNYSGTAEDTRHLVDLVLPQVLSARP